MAGLAVVAAAPRLAARDRGQLVLANWGGAAVEAMTRAFADGFAADTGARLVIDGSGPTPARIRTMVESGRVVWDVCDAGLGVATDLGRRGLLEAVDYRLVDRARVPDGFAGPWGVACSAVSTVLAWDRGALAEVPTGWADFFDPSRAPGRRAVPRAMVGVLEAATLADGVDPGRLYPIDVDRALAKIAALRPSLVAYGSAGEAERLLRDGQVAMACLPSVRLPTLITGAEDRFGFTWRDGVLAPGVWIVPRGNPAGAIAWRFIAGSLEPARQRVLFDRLGLSPGNPEAARALPPASRRFAATDPEHLAKQVVIDGPWYADHHAAAHRRYLEIIAT
jgi:putative spermidine/putrescine transport system substrate-binding protein